MKMSKKIFSLGLATAMIAGSMTTAMAELQTIVATEEGVNYEYDLSDLNDAYAEYQLDANSADALLYTDFMDKTAVAFNDSVKGYVSSKDINDAYAEAQLEGQNFDADAYAETNAAAADAASVSNLKTVKVVDGAIDVEDKPASDEEAPVIVYDGETTLNVENGAEFVAPVVTGTDNVDESVEVTKVIKDAEGSVLEAIDTTVAGTYTVTYSAVDAAGNAAEDLVITVVVAEAAQGLVVDSVSAINGTVTVTLAEAVEAVTAEDFTVTQAIDGAEATPVTPSAAVLSEDGLTATLTVAEVAPTAAEQSVVYTVNEVAAEAFTVEADATAPIITAASSVDVTDNGQKLTFTVADNEEGAGVDAESIVVKQGETALEVTAEEAANTYSVLLNEVQGVSQTLTIDAADAATNAASQKSVTLVDKTKPTITGVEAINNKTIVATFSEPLDSSTGANSAIDTFAKASAVKYTLYNKTNGTSVRLTSDAQTDTVQVTATFANPEKTQVKFNIVAVGSAVTGFPNDGLANGGYILYASNVNDTATVGNTIVAGSPYEFTGTLTPDTTAPALISSSFNSASGLVTLVFDKPTTGAKPADDKLYFQVGENKVLLKNASDYTGISGTSTVTFTVNTTAGTGTLAKINALGANPQIVLEAGAFTDGSNTTAAITSTPTIVTAPILNAVTYDENTNTAVYKFNKTIDVSEIVTFANKFNLGGVSINSNAAATFNTKEDSTDLSFTLSDADAQAVETALRGGTLTASVANGTVKDTETTPNSNVAASSSVTLEAGTTYIKDETAPTLVSSKYNGDTNVVELTFNESVRNNIADFVKVSVEFYKDDNGVAGIQTTVVGGVVADTKIATFADTDSLSATDNHAIDGTAGYLVTDATAGTTATANSEKTTLFFIDKNATGTNNLDDSIDAAIAANKDVYVNILAGGVKDPSANATTEAQSVKVTNVAVSNAAAVTGATDTTVNSNGSVTVKFKNANGAVVMDPTTATDPANYDIYLTANPLSKAQIESITMNATNTEATIVFSTPLVASQAYSYTTSGIKTASNAVGDIDGTIVVAETFNAGAGPDTITLSATQNAVLTDVNSSGTVSAGDTIELTFNEEVKLPTGFSASDVTVDNAHSLGNSTIALSADKKTVTVTVGSTATVAVGDKLTFPTTIKDYEGNALASGAGQTSNAITVAGNTAPTILSASYADTNADGTVSTGDTLTVKFNQNVSIKSGSTVADLLDDISVGTTDFSAASVSGDTLTLTVGSTVGTLAIGDTVTTGTVDLVNSWGTAASDGVGKAIAKSDVTAPTVTGVSYKASTNELTFTFSEAVNLVTDTDNNDLAAALAADLIANGGSLGAAFTAATLSADYKSVTITLDGDEALDQYATISIAAGAFGTSTKNVQDASGNIAVRGQGTAYDLTIVTE